MCGKKVGDFKKLPASKYFSENVVVNSGHIKTYPNLSPQITILKRSPNDANVSSKILHPIRPYHERYKDYKTKRDQIFQIYSIYSTPRKQTKRLTIRLRSYFKRRKLTRKYVISSIITNDQDKRFYAKISFLELNEYGLLDTGANVSCIGSSLAQNDFSRYDQFISNKSGVKTADGTIQKTIGFLNVDVTFRNETRKSKMLIVPSITQRVILGLDFWRAFNLAPELFEPAIITEPNTYQNSLNTFVPPINKLVVFPNPIYQRIPKIIH